MKKTTQSKTTAKTTKAKTTRKYERHEKVAFKDTTKVVFVKARPKEGGRTKLLSLVPKSGITVKQLTVKAKAEEIAASKVIPWLGKLHYYGFIAAR